MADLGLAPVEKSVQNIVYHRNRVVVRIFLATGAAARGGASGTFWAGDQSCCVAFFDTVVLIYYTHIFDEIGK